VQFERITIPERSLILLIGASGSGKSTFARKHFRPSEIVSSDNCRLMVADDEADQDATADAFDVLRCIAAKRLSRGRLTVIDATNVQPEARQRLLELARQFEFKPVAIVLNLPEEICLAQSTTRPGRIVRADVIRAQLADLRQSLSTLLLEGFYQVHSLTAPEDIEAIVLERVTTGVTTP
jgi:protein phosphatase